jgi:hypothetical protein
MTRFKTANRNDQSVRVLDDAALDAAAGGVKDGGCMPGRTLPTTTFPTGDWTFRDVFARYTIGRA